MTVEEEKELAEVSYDKYLVPLPVEKDAVLGSDLARFKGSMHFDGAPFYFVWHPIPVVSSEPFFMIKDPHAHEFDQYLGFFAGDPMHLDDFHAEIELYLGAERKKYLINKPMMVHVPKGLIHGPLIFVKVIKPMIFLDITMSAMYKRA